MALLTRLGARAALRWSARGLAIAAAWPLLLAPGVTTAAPDGPTEYDVKAAFIYRIAQFVEWPAAEANPPLRLCVLGHNPFGNRLEGIQGRQVQGRTLETAMLSLGADLDTCSIVFIPAQAEAQVDHIIALSPGSGMLTVGDSAGFAERGVMVNFFLDNDRVRFEINPAVARQAGLVLSSRLLALARIVVPEAR